MLPGPLDTSSGFGCLESSLDDSGVGSATAEIASQPRADLLQGRIGMLLKKRGASYHEPGRAKPALLGIMLDKGALHGVRPLRRAEPFHGDDFAPLGLNRQHRAGIDRPPIH